MTLSYFKVKDFIWWFKVFQCLSEARSVHGTTEQQIWQSVLPYDQHLIWIMAVAWYGSGSGFWFKILFCSPQVFPFLFTALLYNVSGRVYSYPRITYNICEPHTTAVIYTGSPQELLTDFIIIFIFSINITYFHMNNKCCAVGYWMKIFCTLSTLNYYKILLFLLLIQEV